MTMTRLLEVTRGVDLNRLEARMARLEVLLQHIILRDDDMNE